MICKMWNSMLYHASDYNTETNYEYFHLFHSENTYDKKYYFVQKNGTSYVKMIKVLKKDYEKNDE